MTSNQSRDLSSRTEDFSYEIAPPQEAEPNSAEDVSFRSADSSSQSENSAFQSENWSLQSENWLQENSPLQEEPRQSNNTQPSDPTKGEQESLQSWATVESEMKKEDEVTMRGHMEDIDYLLVFAGLFSAVLTAFVVDSYQQLQPDNQETSSKILRRISIQLESFTPSRGLANSTLPVPDLPSLDFTADTAARWINILWFLSLIFSLAAALFGILVKQWIREYMRWNAALAHPRDNVLVRQIRFEAWSDWNVPATIVAVPALLEVALVFFVCGLVILLWTLDPVVSIVITTAAAVFLSIAATFTFLPAFFRRCPYKSPTAWAFAVFWDFLTRYIPRRLRAVQLQLGVWLNPSWWSRAAQTPKERFGRLLMKTSGLYGDRPRIGNCAAFAHDWRSRDLAHLWTSLWPGTKRDDAIPLLEELRLERRGPPTDFSTIGYSLTLPAVLHNAQRVITELSPLVRALAWVSQASQDARTQAHVLSCIESLETRFTLPHDLSTDEDFISDFFDEDGVRAASYWHLALDMLRERARVGGQNPMADERKDMVSLRNNIKFPNADIDGQSGFYSEPESYLPMRAYWIGMYSNSPEPEALTLVRLLVYSVKALVAALLNRQLSSPLREQNEQRLRQYLAVLYYFGRCSDLYSSADHGDMLYDIFGLMVHQDASIWDSFPEWQPVMLETTYIIGSPKLKKLINDLEIEPEHRWHWSPSPEEVSRIVRALSSGPPNTTRPQDTQSYDVVQDGDVPLNQALSRLLRHPASVLRAAHLSLPNASRHSSKASLEPLRSVALTISNPGQGDTDRDIQACIELQSKELPPRSPVVMGEDEENTTNGLTGISAPQLESHEPTGNIAGPSRADTALEQMTPSEASSSHIVNTLPSWPSHGSLREEPTSQLSSIPGEEGQGKAHGPIPPLTSISESLSDSNNDECTRPTEGAAGNTPKLQPADVPPIDTPPEQARSMDVPPSQATGPSLPSLLLSLLTVSSESSGQHGGSPGDRSCTSSSPPSHPSPCEYKPTDEPAGSMTESPHDIAQAKSAPLLDPSSSHTTGPSSFPRGALDSSPTASAESPRQHDADFDNAEFNNAGENGACPEDGDDGPPARAFDIPAGEEQDVARNAAELEE